ncbi:MAG: hypothetical protein H6737_11580 [Alphaproteobacteria bacterium]|nr:hypothetical protein [Alphaproteobacteria bacterium]
MLTLILSTALAGEASSKATVGYPRGGEGDHECRSRVLVDAEGKAKHVLVEGCPADFAGRVREALALWRWNADGTTFIEERVVRFRQDQPWANAGPVESVEHSVDLLLVDRHHSELKPKEAIPPKFPTAASGQEGKCKATVVVPVEGGHPLWVGVEGCEEVFHLAARMAMYAWDFEPVSEPGEARWVRSKIALVFTEPAPPEPLDRAAYAELLELKESPKPTFPAGGKKYAPATCRAELTVKKNGRASDITVTECDPIFHVATENALGRWAWAQKGEPREVRIVEEIPFTSKKDARDP